MARSLVMALLAAGVPITLLCDLAASRPPESEAINLNERPRGDSLLFEWADAWAENPPGDALAV